jgi:hypothetical protein
VDDIEAENEVVAGKQNTQVRLKRKESKVKFAA